MSKETAEYLARTADVIPVREELQHSFIHNVRQSAELNWWGQLVQDAALHQVYGTSFFSPYPDAGTFQPTWDDLKDLPLEQARDMAGIDSKIEWDQEKLKYRWNNERRHSLGEQGAWGAELASGLIDPVNFLPMAAYAKGLGFRKNFTRMLPTAAAGVVPSEVYRHHLDPTSTALETVMGVLFGTATASAFGAGVGRLGEALARGSIRDFNRTMGNDQPASDTGATRPDQGYSREQFDAEYPGGNWDDFVNGRMDDGLGPDHPRYQMDDGRRIYTINDPDGIHVHVNERVAGDKVLGDKDLGTFRKGEIPKDVIDPAHAKRVRSFDSLDAKQHVELGVRDSGVSSELDDQGVPGHVESPQERRAKYDAETQARIELLENELRNLEDGKTQQMKDLENERRRLQRLLKNEKRLQESALKRRQDPGKVAPASTAAHQKLHSILTGKDPKILDVADWLIANSNDRVLVNILRRIHPSLSDGILNVRPRLVDEDGTPSVALGRYNALFDYISVAKEKGFDPSKNAEIEEVLTHEMIHMATFRKLEPIMHRPVSTLTKAQKQLRAELEALEKRIVAHFGRKKETENIHEIFAYGLSRPEFRNALAQMPYQGKQTVWSKFTEILKRILGLKDDSELTHLIQLFDRQAIRSADQAGAPHTRTPADPQQLVADHRERIQKRLDAITGELNEARQAAKDETGIKRKILEEQLAKEKEWVLEINEAGLSAEDFAAAPVLGGFERKLGALDMPWYRLNGTKLREIAPDLATDWIRLARKLAGSPDLLQGSGRAGTGASIEGMAKQWNGKMMDAINSIHGDYNKMIGGSPNVSSFGIYARDKGRGAMKMIRGAQEKLTGRAHDTNVDQEPMRLGEFYDAVGEAMITGKAANPHIEQAASTMQKLYKEMGDDLERMGGTNTPTGIKVRIQKTETRLAQLQATARGLKNQQAIDFVQRRIEDGKKKLKSLNNLLKAVDDPRLFKDTSPFFHRIWDGEAVRTRTDELREILKQHYLKYPYVRFGSRIKQMPTNEFMVEERVEETIKVILGEIDKNDTLDTIKDPNGTGLPSELIGRKLDIPNELVKDFMVRDVRLTSDIYAQRVGPQLEMMREFGDNAMRDHIDNLFIKAYEAEASPAALKEIKALQQSAQDLRDVVLGNYYIGPDASSVTSRTIRGLMQYNMITSMGRVFYVTLNDVGKSVMAFGLSKTFGSLFRNMAEGASGEFRAAAREVRMAGEALDLANNQRAYELFGAQGDMVGRTRLERGINNLTGTTFIVNLMSPWTDHAKATFGGMMQSKMIEHALDWHGMDDMLKKKMAKIGMTEEFAARVAQEWKDAGSQKGETLFLANTGAWKDVELVRQFRGMLADEVNRLVMTPGAATQPLFLHNDWARLVTQYKKFGMVATQNLLMAGLQRKEAKFMSTVLAMVGISFLVDMWKSPDYIELPMTDRLYRAIEISGVTGILLDANSMLEGATGGEWGARALLGLQNFERNPTMASRTGAMLGPVVNQWGALTQAIVDPSQETADMARAVRYTLPWNNMLWWNDMTNRIQRTTVQTIEDFED